MLNLRKVHRHHLLERITAQSAGEALCRLTMDARPQAFKMRLRSVLEDSLDGLLERIGFEWFLQGRRAAIGLGDAVMAVTRSEDKWQAASDQDLHDGRNWLALK